MKNAIAICACVILLIAVAVAPALAQDQGFEASGIKSGNANPSVKISNSGDFVNLCTPIQQVANTGNVINEQGVLQANNATNDQYADSDQGNTIGDIDMEGSSINIDPTLDASCDQAITVSN